MSKQHKKLLQYFLDNPDMPLSKEDLIENVWNGRIVAGNTIDQSLSKLNKCLNECQQDEYFETAYGQGKRFLPKVSKSPEKLKNIKRVVLVLILSTFIFSYALYTHFSTSAIDVNNDFHQKEKPMYLMVIPHYPQIRDSKEKNTWLNDSSWTVLEQLIKYGEFAQLKAYNKKPQGLDDKQYLDFLWGISHDLNTLTVSLSKKKNIFTILLELTNNEQVKSSYKGSDEKLSSIFLHSNMWLKQQFNYSISDKDLLPENSYLLELYMRGLSSLTHGEQLKASHFFKIGVSDDQTFILARLELVKIKIRQGRSKEALVLLDAAMNDGNLPVKISFEVTKLRSKAYEIENEFELAGKLLKDTINKFKNSDYPEINELKYQLSAIYQNLKQDDLALSELKNISVSIVENPELAAIVLQQQAVIYLNNTEFIKAEKMATKSLEIYAKLGDSLSLAKSHRLLAKIAVAELDNKSAETYLLQALSIYRSLSAQIESDLVIVDILNELISVLIDQGQLTKATKLILQLQQIAVSRNLDNILIDSKYHAIVIAMKQRKWLLAKQELQAHKILVNGGNHQTGLINNQLLNIELLLNQNISDGVEVLFTKLQADLKKTQEDFWLNRVNLLRARYFILERKTQKAIDLLITVKFLAKSRLNYKSLIEINNILAQQYLLDRQSNKALSVLQESGNYKPFAYPFLLLKSKVNRQIGKNMKALELALESKRKSLQLWSIKDEDYLKTLVELNKSI